jgi:hypothetical protein
MNYRGFVGDMATYIACNFGDAAYFEFNQAACHHGLRDCGAGAPVTCEVCGDNQQQVGESCDGADLGGSTCEALGFDGGVLLCNDSCEFDTLMCTTSASTGDESGMPTGGPTTGFLPTTSGDPASSTTDQSSTTTGGADGDGCDCRQDARSITWPAWLLAGGLLARRRRVGKTGMSAVLAGYVLLLPYTGWSGKDGVDASTMATTNASSEGTSTDGMETASDSSGSMVSTRLYGVFHNIEVSDGLKWEQPKDDAEFLIWWGNILIEPDSSLHFEYYYCGDLVEVQSFTWEQDGEGIRVVSPNGKGEPFKWGGSQLLDVFIRPGETCGELLIQGHQVGAEEPFPRETYVPGQLCTINASQTSCEFEFKWCEGPPPSPECD